jgi:hypothetical protein
MHLVRTAVAVAVAAVALATSGTSASSLKQKIKWLSVSQFKKERLPGAREV